MREDREEIKAFISYAYDSDEHKAWVLKLACDLRNHGVDVILDQWDARLGDDLAFFMEQGLTSSHVVICVCSDAYKVKADSLSGGVGYEKRIISASMYSGCNSAYVIPIVRNNSNADKLPFFLWGLKYEDFDKGDYYSSYDSLIRRIYGEDLAYKPPLGSNPFKNSLKISEEIDEKLQLDRIKYMNVMRFGVISFDYKTNSGAFTIGNGEYEFITKWSECGNDSIYCYKDSVLRIGYNPKFHDFPLMENLKEFDFSSRCWAVSIGNVVVLENKYHKFAAVKVMNVVRGVNNIGHKVEFKYSIYE